MSPVDIREPIDDVSRYLVAKNEALGYISPKIAEDVVASAFKNVGYFVEQTPYIGDDGIDMYLLNGTGAREIAVQVKRWNKKVSVEPIRSFLGALMLAGITKGIMVLTGGYTKGAADAASKAKDYRLSHIDLKDGNWLLSTLKAGLNPRYSSIVDPNAPFRTLIEDPLLVQSWDRWRQWD
jgi:restriction endonuclease Mrr